MVMEQRQSEVWKTIECAPVDSVTVEHVRWGVRWDGRLPQDLLLLSMCASLCDLRALHLFGARTTGERPSFPSCAHRSCTTSKAWKCRETWRGSWSRSCSRTQTTPLCWRAGATLPGVCSSRCPSAPPQTWSRLSPARIRFRVARWPSTCLQCRLPHASGQCNWNWFCRIKPPVDNSWFEPVGSVFPN